MFKIRRRLREDEEWDISRIVPKVEILNQVQDDGGMPDQVRHDVVRDDVVQDDEGDIVRRFSIDLEERLKCNMRQSKEDATLLEKIINNKL